MESAKKFRIKIFQIYYHIHKQLAVKLAAQGVTQFPSRSKSLTSADVKRNGMCLEAIKLR